MLRELLGHKTVNWSLPLNHLILSKREGGGGGGGRGGGMGISKCHVR